MSAFRSKREVSHESSGRGGQLLPRSATEHGEKSEWVAEQLPLIDEPMGAESARDVTNHAASLVFFFFLFINKYVQNNTVCQGYK